jgi:hypothetical protein
MTIKKKLAKIFNTRVSEDRDYSVIFDEVSIRGRVNTKTMLDIIVVLLEEIESLKENSQDVSELYTLYNDLKKSRKKSE